MKSPYVHYVFLVVHEFNIVEFPMFMVKNQVFMRFPMFSRKKSPGVPGDHLPTRCRRRARVVAARGRAARLGVAVAQLCGAAIEVVPDWQIAACRVSLDWFKGKSTGNHGFLPLNMFLFL